MKDGLMQIARNIVESSEGRLRLAFNEEDATTEAQPEAAHFLKLDGKRLGRDIELYAFMGEVAGNAQALIHFAEEVVIRLRDVPESYRVASDCMKALGRQVLPEGMVGAWEEIFNTTPA